MKTNPFMRYTSLAMLFGFMGVVIVFKLINVQVFPQKHDLERQEYYHSGEMRQIVPTRGKIYDRWGHLLAGNEVVYEVGVDLPSMVNPDTVALVASSMLDWDYEEVISILDFGDGEPPYQYLMLADFVPAEKADEIQQYMTRIKRIQPRE